ncbi:MAG: DUF3048 domain-containing protein [Oscillospiraceae bacterium]|nr:DUF3048 domain-containing protein [Oscillospiraceae bacterium]
MYRKSLTALLALALTVGLTACSSKPPEESEPPDSQPSVSVMAPVEPESVLPYVNPLTGEGCAQDIAQKRPVAVMLNNLKKALPQLGVSQADIIYEAPAEGGITRMLAVFQSVEEVGDIGSVRSARDYYVSLAMGHDALYLHAGGSPGAYAAIKNWGAAAFDCVNGPYEGTLFWRDKERRRSMGMEHSVLTSGQTISELMPTYSYRLEHKEGYQYPAAFLAEGEKAQGAPGNRVSVEFSTYKTGVFTYQPETGSYLVEEYGAPYLDGNTGEQVAVKNVLVLRTDVSYLQGDDAGRLSVRTTGTGTGQLFCDGTVQDITWFKAKHGAPMTYCDQSGQPLKLGVGPTYVNLVDHSAQVTVN